MQKVLIIGATSAIAQQAARCFAAAGANLFLVARDRAKLDATASDLRLRGAARVETLACDLLDFSRHGEIVEASWTACDGLDAALIAHGTLGDQKKCEADYAEAEREVRVNFLSVVSLCTPLANRMEAQRKGTLAVISSVAGERGRQSNYVYGSAKGATTLFLQGLRNRLHPAGVRVVTVLPGFVDTPMTAAVPKTPLFASAEKVGRGVYDAMRRGRDVAYLPWFWRGIMCVIRSIPECIFKKLKL